MNLPPNLRLVAPDNTQWESQEPSALIKFSCTNIKRITLNSTQLTDQEVKDICGSTGYTVELKDGNNEFNFIGQNDKNEETGIQLTISFSQLAYDSRKAQEETDKQQEPTNTEEEVKPEDNLEEIIREVNL